MRKKNYMESQQLLYLHTEMHAEIAQCKMRTTQIQRTANTIDRNENIAEIDTFGCLESAKLSQT